MRQERYGRGGRPGTTGTALVDRKVERAAIDDMVQAVGLGQSRVLVLRGGAGIGKTALLDYARTTATGLRVLSTTGVESDMELAFAALHQLLLPLLDGLAELPGPRRAALEVVFRMREGPAPDPLLVGVAVLNLLSDASERGPLLWRGRRRAMARPGVGAGTRLRRPAPAGRVDPAAVLRPHARP
ncbi:hypothetical protein ACGFJ7_18310 [Actinoplanes sp. NPDC048988]|uniref:hypothetical protein n=1 Tax=Actinoplanes sp. NPDC048988 TaxID=3363901 RepID=UPI003711A798